MHLPWCLKKCPYCDFNSHEWRSGGDALPEQRYLDALVADLEAALPLIWGRTVHSIFIGGGTPSLFSPDSHRPPDRRRARAAASSSPTARSRWRPIPAPSRRTASAPSAQAGVTRLSVGVQSFNDEHLKALGRVHDRAQAIAAVEEAAVRLRHLQSRPDVRAAGPDAWPSWSADLVQALALEPPHLSVYHLTIEPNTYFAKFPPRGPR